MTFVFYIILIQSYVVSTIEGKFSPVGGEIGNIHLLSKGKGTLYTSSKKNIDKSLVKYLIKRICTS